MTIDSWTPANTNSTTLASEALALMIAAGERAAPDTSIIKYSPCDTCHFVMKQNLEFWQKQSSTLQNSEIIALIRFFTAAEEADDLWFGGIDSPVIHLTKVLKSRNERLDKELLRWIKQHSSNHYLPNGPIQL